MHTVGHAAAYAKLLIFMLSAAFLLLMLNTSVSVCPTKECPWQSWPLWQPALTYWHKKWKFPIVKYPPSQKPEALAVLPSFAVHQNLKWIEQRLAFELSWTAEGPLILLWHFLKAGSAVCAVPFKASTRRMASRSERGRQRLWKELSCLFHLVTSVCLQFYRVR